MGTFASARFPGVTMVYEKYEPKALTKRNSVAKPDADGRLRRVAAGPNVVTLQDGFDEFAVAALLVRATHATVWRVGAWRTPRDDAARRLRLAAQAEYLQEFLGT